MPYDAPDPADPLQLVGIGVACDTDAQREMAGVFAEEFARLGYDRDRLMHLFRNPFYAAAHRALRILGEAEIERLVDETVKVWGRVRLVDHDCPEPRRLPEGEPPWPRSTTGS